MWFCCARDYWLTLHKWLGSSLWASYFNAFRLFYDFPFPLSLILHLLITKFNTTFVSTMWTFCLFQVRERANNQSSNVLRRWEPKPRVEHDLKRDTRLSVSLSQTQSFEIDFVGVTGRDTAPQLEDKCNRGAIRVGVDRAELSSGGRCLVRHARFLAYRAQASLKRTVSVISQKYKRSDTAVRYSAQK